MLDPATASPSNVSPMDASNSQDDLQDAIFRSISKTLLEEDVGESSSTVHDSAALQAAEDSFYQVLCQTHSSPTSTHTICSDHNGKHPQDAGESHTLHSPYFTSASTNFCLPNNKLVVSPLATNKLPHLPNETQVCETDSILLFHKGAEEANSVLQSYCFPNSKLVVSSSITNPPPVDLYRTLMCDTDPIFLFHKGLEEASKLLPSCENPTLGNAQTVKKHLRLTENNNAKYQADEADLRKERAKKQLAVYEEDDDFSELFERLFLTSYDESRHQGCHDGSRVRNRSRSSQPDGVKTKKTLAKKQRYKANVIDTRIILLDCAEALAGQHYYGTAKQLLKQIRQHSSPLGDASQRIAHYFANGLEARLAGTGAQLSFSKKLTAASMLKAYKPFLAVCPFRKIASYFVNYHTLKIAERADKLHIIDFGIMYGFQWPLFIQHLSARPGGPPKLRITGIEVPEPGLQPAFYVEQAHRRVAKYCQRFTVPFEYNGIAQKWDTIKIEDLKIEKGEVIVVNSLFRFERLLDDTVELNSPRAAVLNLIQSISPDAFFHGVFNGSHNSPSFLRRFREALFYYSAFYDMFETVLAPQSTARMVFESDIFGTEIMNVIACEGRERTVRPQTYKQWQVQNEAAGFSQLPIDKKFMDTVRADMGGYNRNFMLEEDGNWLLQGWKGKIVSAITYWAPGLPIDLQACEHVQILDGAPAASQGSEFEMSNPD